VEASAVKLLVTGGAGFIGSHYVRSVLTGSWGLVEPVRVVVLDKLTYAGNLANLDPVAGEERLSFVHGDVCDALLVDSLVADADAVVHFAAESHVDRSLEHARDFVETNVLGTQTLLDAARRHPVERFVHVSTDEVYGSIEEGSWTEDEPLRPSSPYSASKAAADLMARAYARSHRVPVCTTRCSNTYGPYQHPEKVIPLFVTNLLDGLTVPLYGDGLHVRDWLHVDDHCRGVHLALTRGRPGEVYHVGGGTELTNWELTRLLLEATGSGADRVQQVPDRAAHDRRYSLDTTKTARELGYRPRVDFGAGLADTVEWYRTHREWWAPLKDAGYLRAEV
jgi:dTDP-glucose 4,6-dehydratase